MPRPRTKPPGPGTTPTQVRLTDADKAKLAAIQERFGLLTLAAAIRHAIETVYQGLEPKKPARKARSTA